MYEIWGIDYQGQEVQISALEDYQKAVDYAEQAKREFPDYSRIWIDGCIINSKTILDIK